MCLSPLPILIAFLTLGLALAGSSPAHFTTPRSLNRIAEPAWHRRERGQRSQARHLVRLAKAAERLDAHHGSCSGLGMAPAWTAGSKPKRAYLFCSAYASGCKSWIWDDRVGAFPKCPCGQPWSGHGKGPAKPAAAAAAGRKGRWWSKEDKPDKWQNQLDDAKEKMLWELAQEAGPESDEMSLFRKRYPNSKRLEAKAEQPAAVVAARAAQRLQTLEQKLQGISKRHEDALEIAKTCQAEGVKVASEIRHTKQILKEAESKVNPVVRPEETYVLGRVMPLQALTTEQVALLNENPAARDLAEDFNKRYADAEARGKVLHDKVRELMAQKEELKASGGRPACGPWTSRRGN